MSPFGLLDSLPFLLEASQDFKSWKDAGEAHLPPSLRHRHFKG